MEAGSVKRIWFLAMIVPACVFAQPSSARTSPPYEFEPFLAIQRSENRGSRFAIGCVFPWQRIIPRFGVRGTVFPFARARRVGLELQLMASGAGDECTIPLLPPPPDGDERQPSATVGLGNGRGFYSAARVAYCLMESQHASGTVGGGLAFMPSVGRPLGTLGAQLDIGGADHRITFAIDGFGTRIPFVIRTITRRNDVVVAQSTERATASLAGVFYRIGLTWRFHQAP
jgi:hypothetical protein